MIKVTTSGSFAKTEAFLKRLGKADIQAVMRNYGKMGVSALAAATPRDSGIASESWGFVISGKGGKYTISWTNSDIENGHMVAIAIQFGHGTGTGGYVQGRDYINPAIRPIFDQLAAEVWKVVISA